MWDKAKRWARARFPSIWIVLVLAPCIVLDVINGAGGIFALSLVARFACAISPIGQFSAPFFSHQVLDFVDRACAGGVVGSSAISIIFLMVKFFVMVAVPIGMVITMVNRPQGLGVQHDRGYLQGPEGKAAPARNLSAAALMLLCGWGIAHALSGGNDADPTKFDSVMSGRFVVEDWYVFLGFIGLGCAFGLLAETLVQLAYRYILRTPKK